MFLPVVNIEKATIKKCILKIILENDVLRTSLNKFYANMKAVCFPLHVYLHIYMFLPVVNIEKATIKKCILKIILENDVLRTSRKR